MALDLFFVFIIFAECERVFLSAKTLIIERRNKFKEDIIEVYTLLRYWIKEDRLK